MPTKHRSIQAASQYADLYRQLFVDQYPFMQYSYVQFFADHLRDLYRVFEADLQSALIVAIVGRMDVEASIRSSSARDGTPPDAAVDTPRPINASRLAEVTGIPRETVRRKLETLAGRGWIERDADGVWHIKTEGPDMAPARRELADVEVRQMERVARYLGLMHALAEDAQPRSDQRSD